MSGEIDGIPEPLFEIEAVPLEGERELAASNAADSARLSWIEQRAADVQCNYGTWTVRQWNPFTDETAEWHGDSLREAIDKARGAA